MTPGGLGGWWAVCWSVGGERDARAVQTTRPPQLFVVQAPGLRAAVSVNSTLGCRPRTWVTVLSAVPVASARRTGLASRWPSRPARQSAQRSVARSDKGRLTHLRSDHACPSQNLGQVRARKWACACSIQLQFLAFLALAGACCFAMLPDQPLFVVVEGPLGSEGCCKDGVRHRHLLAGLLGFGRHMRPCHQSDAWQRVACLCVTRCHLDFMLTCRNFQLVEVCAAEDQRILQQTHRGGIQPIPPWLRLTAYARASAAAEAPSVW